MWSSNRPKWQSNSSASKIRVKNYTGTTYRLACLVMVEPTTGTAACGVSATIFAGIWPAACIALYWRGVMCSNPGGGTSQYREGLRLLDLVFLPLGERDLLLLRSLRSLLLDLDLFLSRPSRERDLRRRSKICNQHFIQMHTYNRHEF